MLKYHRFLSAARILGISTRFHSHYSFPKTSLLEQNANFVFGTLLFKSIGIFISRIYVSATTYVSKHHVRCIHKKLRTFYMYLGMRIHTSPNIVQIELGTWQAKYPAVPGLSHALKRFFECHLLLGTLMCGLPTYWVFQICGRR